MKNILILCFSTILSFTVNSQSDTYSLVFTDDFDGSTLDLTKWNKETGYAPNQEKQYYTDSPNNIRVENGNLIITARKEQAVSNRNYTSGRINTKGKGYLKYGKIEARISVPSGAGTWPAFWMMSENNEYGTWPNSGEIDIMEHIGSDPRMISHAVHTANKNGSRGNNWYRRIYKDNVENNFHVYALNWSQDEIQFIVDDVVSTTLYRNFTEDYRGWPFNIDYHVILNLAMGGTMGGIIDDNIFNNPVELKVDYVRIYQLNTAINNPHNTAITAYPTHFGDVLNINTELPTNIKIFNHTGNLMLEKTITGTEKIDTSHLPCGIYIVHSLSKTMKVIKL